MSTRCVVTVIDVRNTIHIYRHMDGYPTSLGGVLATLPQALPFAWPLPRFESMDFAAAIIRAWKQPGGGNIYITAHYERHGDLEYRYQICQKKDLQLHVTTFEMTNCGWKKRGETPLVAGGLKRVG